MIQNANLTGEVFCIIIPAYNAVKHLQDLWDSLQSQTLKPDEIILVDDGSTDGTEQLAKRLGFTVYSQGKNLGPAAARNRGVKEARGAIYLFTDTDCRPSPEWAEFMIKWLSCNGVESVAGDTRVVGTTFFEKSVASLGFPGGAGLGFEKVWRVDSEGWTSSFSSCNLGLKHSFFEEAGYFDESFPVPGGEDTVLAYNFVHSGKKIKFARDAIVIHEAMPSFKKFSRWMFIRGRGNYHIGKRVDKIGSFVKLRLWHLGNIIKCHGVSFSLPFVLILYQYMIVMQIAGLVYERNINSRN